MYFQTSLLERISDDYKRRQAITTHIPSLHALFSEVCKDYGKACQLQSLPASAFALKNWSTLDRLEHIKQPQIVSFQDLSVEQDYHLATQMAKRKEKIKRFSKAFYSSGFITVMPSLTLFS